MAVDRFEVDETLVTAADLTGKRYYGVKRNGSGLAVLATAGVVWGVLQDEQISGRAVPVRRRGVSKVICGGVVAIDAYVTTDASGKFVAVTPGAVSAYSQVIGQAREAGILNDIIAVYVFDPIPVGSA